MSIDVNWNSQGFLHNHHVNRFSVCKGSQWAVFVPTDVDTDVCKGSPRGNFFSFTIRVDLIEIEKGVSGT